MTKPRLQDLTDWLERSLNEGRNLTDWERGFLEGIHDHLTMRGIMPSERQIEILERIYTEKVPYKVNKQKELK